MLRGPNTRARSLWQRLCTQAVCPGARLGLVLVSLELRLRARGDGSGLNWTFSRGGEGGDLMTVFCQLQRVGIYDQVH